MTSNQKAIEQTKKWINDVVISCNFCPFAARVMMQQKVHYQVDNNAASVFSENNFIAELKRLDEDKSIETSFLIFPYAYRKFDDYLGMLEQAEKLLIQKKYEGVYQLASFHPQYLFADSKESDPANYTNRSAYPMLHILREESIDRALAHYENPEQIPEKNIDFARKKGLVYMKMLRDTCFNV